MKKIIIIITLLYLINDCYSQDIIFFKNRNVAYTKIIEVSERDISYKDFNDQQGATFVVSVNRIDSIKWQNGKITKYILPKYIFVKERGSEFSIEEGNSYQLNGDALAYSNSSGYRISNPVYTTNLSFVYLYRFDPTFSLGASVGFEYSDWDQREDGIYGITRFYNSYHIPLLARLKIDFLRKQKHTPYFVLDVGYNFLVGTSYTWKHRENSYKIGGFNISPSIGGDFRFRDNSTIYFHIGYYLHGNKDSDRHSERNLIHSIAIRLGYKFR
jgi:hypothetical protein